MNNPVVWSLFSGAMGLDLGLEQAGLPASVLVEVDSLCCETIALNRPRTPVLQADIRDVTAQSLREATNLQGEDVYLVAGGPPCQSFSTGGNRAALSDPRGNLVYEYFRLIDEIRPQYFIFENVASFVTAALKHRPIDQRPGKNWNLSHYSKKGANGNGTTQAMSSEELSGSAIRALLQDIKPLGYDIVFGVLNAADYGAAQKRRRFIMIGARSDHPPSLPEPTHGDEGANGTLPWRTLRDEIYSLRSAPGEHCRYSEAYQEVFEMISPGGNWRDLPDDVAQKVMGKSYKAGGGKTGFFRRLSWGAPAPTITGKPNRKGAAMCHPEETRSLSVRECARLQGFPDTWEFAGSMHQQYRQIGNAVPVQLGAAIGSVLCPPVTPEPVVLSHEELLIRSVKTLRMAARNKRRAKGQLSLGLEDVT